MAWFKKVASLPALLSWCRTIRHSLGAGIHITKVFQNLARKGPRELRDVAERIGIDIERGESLDDALAREKDYFPPMFCDLAVVGERTGHMPEVFRELEEYFGLQLQLRRQFISQIMPSVIQFFAAVGIIALTILILGVISEGRDSPPIEPIGMGLSGPNGAIIFLLAVATFLVVLWLIYKVLTRGFRQRAAFESFMLHIPLVGPCTQAFAMGRFCIALRMTLETGMSIAHALRQTMRATSNAAYIAYEDEVVAVVKGGGEVTDALRRCPHFPEELMEAIEVGEVSGQIPEVMIRQSEYWREEASRRLKALTRGAGMAVWALVAILIIIAIFSIARVYLNAVGG